MGFRLTGQFTTRMGENGFVTILEYAEDSQWRVDVVLERGKHRATYSDYFDTFEDAMSWAKQVVEVYGGFSPSHPADQCGACKSTIWPWDETDTDAFGSECHVGCITEVNVPVSHTAYVRHLGGMSWMARCSCEWEQPQVTENEAMKSAAQHQEYFDA